MEWIVLEGEYPSPSWPPVDPTTGITDEVLVVYDDMYFIARYSHPERAWTAAGLYSEDRLGNPSHWMRLPALPEVSP